LSHPGSEVRVLRVLLLKNILAVKDKIFGSKDPFECECPFPDLLEGVFACSFPFGLDLQVQTPVFFDICALRFPVDKEFFLDAITSSRIVVR